MSLRESSSLTSGCIIAASTNTDVRRLLVDFHWINVATYVWAWWWLAAWWWWVMPWWWGISLVWTCSVRWIHLQSDWGLTGTGSGAGSPPRTRACTKEPDDSVSWEEVHGGTSLVEIKCFMRESPTLGGCLRSICQSSWHHWFLRRWKWRRGRSGSSYLSPRQTSQTLPR